MSLRPLLPIAFESDRLRSLAAACASGPPATDAFVSAALTPLVCAALVESEEGLGGHAVLLVTPDDRSARDLAREMSPYLAPRPVRYYPSRGTGYASHVAPPPHLVGLRIAALDSLTGGRGDPVVVASAVALAEAVPDPELRPHGFGLQVGEEVDLDDVAGLLVECGYERVDQVEERGQFAVRGGILDVFAATEDRACRIELFGDEIESMRWFSTFTQRSLGDTGQLDLAPAAELSPGLREQAELALEAAEGETPPLAEMLPVDRFGPVLDLLPPETSVVVAADGIESALTGHWEDVTITMSAEDAGHLYVDVTDEIDRRACCRLSARDAEQRHALRAQRAESPARSVSEAEGELEKLLRSGYRVVVCFDTEGEAERTRFQLGRLDARIGVAGEQAYDGGGAGLEFRAARVREGVVAPDLKLAVIPFRRLVHRRRAAAVPTVGGRRIGAFTELRVGEYVVHEDHGIARFAGFETKTVGGITRDYLELEYQGSDRVFVPSEQLAKLSAYVGGDGAEPKLSKLGGKQWDLMKARARRAAQEMAGELLNLYAERMSRDGHAFSPDGEWQLAFEAAFPHQETADQIDALDQVKGDMEEPRPMDRLICGDVGYGKTEVALRAAHKAAIDGKQTMMLVPTTVLAQQHFGTFRERLADTAVSVEMVSRFRKAAEVREVLGRFADGKVDILIGTHRLLSRDVRAKDLGLLVVDEEQRFGVKQKELLRQLKLRVDVLSLSATPIPRTLQMSLSGMRDISLIATPPEGRRPVRTFVGPYDENLVKRAIERETERGGQTFFLHNRVDTLHETAERLRALCPGVRFLEAHGQMPEGELEQAMLTFLRGDADCLVATTIIESGLDIPNANTLIVEQADMLGLAQAYQIRGRVGRSRQSAFAYLLYPSEAQLTEEAKKRLATLSDHTELGAGFQIAMRDLDIRGAGNLLGDEQSGHVAAVGFELYVRMIEEAVEQLRAGRPDEDEGAAAPEPVRFDVPVDAYLPADYVPYEAAKIEAHRRIVAAREPGELASVEAELSDRFGPPPEPVRNLVALQRARIDFGRAGADRVELRGGRLSASGIELDSRAARALRERLQGALYEWRERTASIRVPDEPGARLAAAESLAGALVSVLEAAEPAGAPA